MDIVFFKVEDRNRVVNILELVCYSHNNIRNLINKSLITIVGGKLWMHNLLQEMGWEIVHKESEEPERCNRLWLYDNVLSVLKNNIVSGLIHRHNLENYIFLLLDDCNLFDGPLPDDLSCLSSLKSLNLSKNNFTSLLDSIYELSELKLLLLDHCSQLKSLPYLPISTQFVSA